MEFERPDKRVQLCWSVYALFAAMLPTVVSFVLFRLPIISRFGARLFTVAWCAILLFFLSVYFPLRRRRIRYRIDEDGITVFSGVCFVTRRRMPLSAVRYFTVLRGPLERAFGLTSLLICAAGGRLLLEGIPTDKAEALTRRIV